MNYANKLNQRYKCKHGNEFKLIDLLIETNAFGENKVYLWKAIRLKENNGELGCNCRPPCIMKWELDKVKKEPKTKSVKMYCGKCKEIGPVLAIKHFRFTTFQCRSCGNVSSSYSDFTRNEDVDLEDDF